MCLSLNLDSFLLKSVSETVNGQTHFTFHDSLKALPIKTIENWI